MLWLPSHCSILEYALFDLNSVSSCRRSMRQAPLRQNYLQTRRKNIYVSRDVELKPVGIECLVEDDTAFTRTEVYHIVNPPATCRSNVTADVLFCNPKSIGVEPNASNTGRYSVVGFREEGGYCQMSEPSQSNR